MVGTKKATVLVCLVNNSGKYLLNYFGRILINSVVEQAEMSYFLCLELSRWNQNLRVPDVDVWVSISP